MAFREVLLIADPKYVNPTDVEVESGDIILFTNDTNYRFTIIINSPSTVFNSSYQALIYDVPAGKVERTPAVKDNPTLPLVYQVYIHKVDDIIPSDAPPRIIRY